MECRVKPGNDGTMRFGGRLLLLLSVAVSAPARARRRRETSAGTTTEPTRRCAGRSGSTARRKQSAHRRRHLPRDRAGRGGERTAGRVLRPRDLAGEPLQCPGRQPQGRAGHCAIHAGDGGLSRACRSVRSDRGAAKFGELSARSESHSSAISGSPRPAYNAGPGRVAALLAEPSPAAERDAQLRRDHHRLDRRRMGLGVAAQDGGDHDPARRAVHAARQSDPGAEGRGAAHRRLCAALGHAAHGKLVGEQGLGDLSHDPETSTRR